MVLLIDTKQIEGLTIKICAMKRSTIYIVALVFSLFIVTDLNAQGHGNGNRGRGKKEYVKRHKDHHKVYQRHAKGHEKSYKEYYKSRDKSYRNYIKSSGKRYRDHDAWYYNKRFHHRSEYVYFPKYRTYYDPYHRRYIYRRHNSWAYSPVMPSFMVGLDFGNLNIQLMGDLPIR